jgi:hypothetical protein
VQQPSQPLALAQAVRLPLLLVTSKLQVAVVVVMELGPEVAVLEVT